jgi:hypothetical protein
MPTGGFLTHLTFLGREPAIAGSTTWRFYNFSDQYSSPVLLLWVALSFMASVVAVAPPLLRPFRSLHSNSIATAGLATVLLTYPVDNADTFLGDFSYKPARTGPHGAEVLGSLDTTDRTSSLADQNQTWAHEEHTCLYIQPHMGVPANYSETIPLTPCLTPRIQRRMAMTGN